MRPRCQGTLRTITRSIRPALGSSVRPLLIVVARITVTNPFAGVSHQSSMIALAIFLYSFLLRQGGYSCSFASNRPHGGEGGGEVDWKRNYGGAGGSGCFIRCILSVWFFGANRRRIAVERIAPE